MKRALKSLALLTAASVVATSAAHAQSLGGFPIKEPGYRSSAGQKPGAVQPN